MALLHLIFLTIFGTLSFVFFLVFILASERSTTSFVIFLILLLLSGIFFRLYTKRTRRDKDAIQKKLTDEKQEWLLYFRQNKESIEAYSKEIDSILTTRYHFKENYRPPPIIPETFESINIDIKMYKEKISPQQAAKIIYETVASQGNDGHPDIFTLSYSKKMLPRFNKIYSVLFGGINPSKQKKAVLILVYAILGLAFYGIPQMLLGPNHDVFIPSPEWKSFITPLIWISSLTTCYFFLKNKSTINRLTVTHGSAGAMAVKIMLFPLCLLFFYFALQIGVGKMMNEMVGREKTIPLLVSKDLDTRKKSGRYGSTDGYCVKILIESASKIHDEYCLQKQHYDMIPDTSPRIMRFHGTISYFGYRIDGYYEDSSTMREMLKDPIGELKKQSSTNLY